MSVPSEDGGASPAERVRDGVARIQAMEVSPRQAAARRVGESVRDAIDQLMATAAPPEVLEEAAAKMADVVALLHGYGAGRSYEGFAEASGLGHDHGFFDWSPVLGRSNPLAPPIDVDVDADGGGAVIGRVRFGAAYEGPPGCVHGGFIAASFDDILGLAQSFSGQTGMTGTLTVRYRQPTPLHTDLRIEARLDSVSGRKVTASASMFAGEVLTAEATGLFITVSPERFGALGANRSGADQRRPG